MSTKITDNNRFNAPCEVCGRTAPGDFVKYSALGFELVYMVCKDCFLIVRIAGLSRLKADVMAFREQLGKGGASENSAND
jgi:ribosome-binding protein aMBF1 (putative translation factor)